MKQPHEMRPGNRYAREQGEGRTLGDLVRAKMALVAICQRCKHRRLIHPANLIQRFGEGYPAINLRPILRCTGCPARAPNLHETAS